MCGQVGIIFGRKRRRPDERDYLREVFIRMLLHSEERGPHASGLAWLKTDGSHRIFKRPMRAHELVYEKPFQELLGQVDNETTILMGHTRWRTRGNEFNNRNNHPIRAGIVIGTHNGTIYNADYLFRRLGLPRYAEVDSELIFRLADRFAPEGLLDDVEQAEHDCIDLIDRWHGQGRNAFAVTVRFAPTSTPEQLATAELILLGGNKAGGRH